MLVSTTVPAGMLLLFPTYENNKHRFSLTCRQISIFEIQKLTKLLKNNVPCPHAPGRRDACGAVFGRKQKWPQECRNRLSPAPSTHCEWPAIRALRPTWTVPHQLRRGTSQSENNWLLSVFNFLSLNLYYQYKFQYVVKCFSFYFFVSTYAFRFAIVLVIKFFQQLFDHVLAVSDVFEASFLDRDRCDVLQILFDSSLQQS